VKPAVRCSILALCGLAALGLAVSAMAQSGANVAAGMPEFRDSRTGKVWTPQFNRQDVNPDPNPNATVNRAFDPRRQDAAIEGVVVQRPRANLMGLVPITAGPTVPIVTIDAPSLQAVPTEHWLTVLYVTNNSANIVDVVVGCLFTNLGQKVQDTRVVIPPAGPGERLGVAVRGPPTDLFVDAVTCRVMTPA
jgi:hypothetical protein